MVSQSPYFQHPVVTSLLFLDELALKEDSEKQAFFQRLPTLLSSFPDEVCKYKVPALACGCLHALNDCVCVYRCFPS
jgi:hypothetical protein